MDDKDHLQTGDITIKCRRCQFAKCLFLVLHRVSRVMVSLDHMSPLDMKCEPVCVCFFVYESVVLVSEQNNG